MADLVQVVREALVAIIDPDPEIVAITGRDSLNFVPFREGVEFERPIMAFQDVVARRLAGDGDTREVLVQVSADAELDSTAQELLGIVERIVTQTAFLSLPTPLDAYVADSIRRGLNLDLTLRVSRSSPVPA